MGYQEPFHLPLFTSAEQMVDWLLEFLETHEFPKDFPQDEWDMWRHHFGEQTLQDLIDSGEVQTLATAQETQEWLDECQRHYEASLKQQEPASVDLKAKPAGSF